MSLICIFEGMYSTAQILSILRERKPDLQKRYPLCELGLFGSYARGDFNEKSDINILVDFNASIDGFEYIRLAHELEDALQYKIGLVSRKGIKSQYVPFIEKSLIRV